MRHNTRRLNLRIALLLLLRIIPPHGMEVTDLDTGTVKLPIFVLASTFGCGLRCGRLLGSLTFSGVYTKALVL